MLVVVKRGAEDHGAVPEGISDEEEVKKEEKES